MDEFKLAEIVRTVVTEAVSEIKQDIAVLKQDIAVLKQDVAVLKQDVAVLKQDVAVLKQDIAVLKQDVAVLKQDVAVLKQDVDMLKQNYSGIQIELKEIRAEIDEIRKEMATKTELMTMEQRFTSAIEKIRETLRISLLEIHDDLEEIKFKMKFYDFDFLLKQNDHLAGVLKDILEERKSLSQRMRDFEERLKLVEAR